MADDPETTDLPTALPEATSETEPVETDTTAEPTEGSETEAPPEDDGIDLEHEGKKYRIPAALKEYLLRQEDYTRKTQEVASSRKELDQERERLTQQAQMDEQEMGARVAIKALDAQIAEYKNVDWAAEFAKDPNNAAAHKAKYDQLREQRGEAANYITQRGQQRTETQRSQDAKRISDTRDWATRNIKGWSEAQDRQITEFVTQGLPEGLRLTPEFVSRNVNPTLYNLMHLAFVGQQTIKRATAPKAPTPPPEPVTQIKPKAPPPPAGLSDRLSPEEWVKRRNAQVQRRA